MPEARGLSLEEKESERVRDEANKWIVSWSYLITDRRRGESVVGMGYGENRKQQNEWKRLDVKQTEDRAKE